MTEYQMTHPLTDQIIEEIAEDVFYYDHSIPIFRCDMRAAADWQLEQVKLTGQCLINELHENKYHTQADHAATFLEVLIEAMRPTQVSSGREGALQALDRLCEENFDGLRRLAQGDN